MDAAFEFAEDPTGRLGSALMPGTAGGGVTVDDEAVVVAFGAPAVFLATIPRSAIAVAERVPDLRSATRGIHGRRGRWLVNRSGRDLVRLRLEPSVDASVALSGLQVPTPRSRLGRWLAKRILRDRSIRLRELTISLRSADAFIDSLRGR